MAIKTGESVKERRTASSSQNYTPVPSNDEVIAAAVVLSVLQEHCNNFKSPVDPVNISRSLRSIWNTSLDELK